MNTQLQRQLDAALDEAAHGNKSATTAVYDIADLLQSIEQGNKLDIANDNLGKVDATLDAQTATLNGSITALATVLGRCETILSNINQRLQDANIKLDQMLVKQQAANDSLSAIVQNTNPPIGS